MWPNFSQLVALYQTLWRHWPVTTSRTAWARRESRVVFVCLMKLSKVGRAASENWEFESLHEDAILSKYSKNYENRPHDMAR